MTAAVQNALHDMAFYARELKKRLPPHVFRPVPARLLWMVPHLAVIASGIIVIALVRLHVAWYLVIGVAIGLSYACLGFVGHEILHGSVVRNRWLRDFFGGICMAAFNVGPLVWRRWHNTEHHAHTQEAGVDPDAMGTLEDYRERFGLRVLYRLAPWLRSLVTFMSFAIWFSVHGFLMFVRFLPQFRPRQRAMALAQLAGPLTLWLGLLLLLGPVKWTFAYVVPLLVANFVVMSYIATNHLLNPLTDVNDPLSNSLTVLTPRWVDVWHLNFSHHTEHHIFPMMSARYAPQVKRLAQQLWPDRYNAMPHWKALLTLWRTPRLYRDDSTLVDPHRNLAYPVLGRGLDPDDVRPLS